MSEPSPISLVFHEDTVKTLDAHAPGWRVESTPHKRILLAGAIAWIVRRFPDAWTPFEVNTALAYVLVAERCDCPEDADDRVFEGQGLGS